MSGAVTSDELPNGWTSAALDEIRPNDSPIIYGILQPGPILQNGVKYVRPTEISNDEIDLNELRCTSVEIAKKYARASLKPDDLIFTIVGTIGKVAMVPPELSGANITQSSARIRPEPSIVDPRYLRFSLKSPGIAKQCEGFKLGTAVPRLNLEDVRKLRVVLAPLAEQKRIADKLEMLLGRVNACRARLDRLPAQLNRFRQTVLAAAISGRLTAELRTGDSAEDLAQFFRSREGTPKEGEQSSGHEILNSCFPDEWARTSFGELFRFIDYRGRNPNKSQSGKRLITAKNIKMGRIEEDPIEFISEKDYANWMTRGFPRRGDILFITEGHTMGCTALNELDEEFALAQRTITLQPLGLLETKFFFYVMLSDAFQSLVRVNATGSAAQGLKAAKLRSLPLAFPSIAEQQEIVRRVETLFAFVDRIEARLAEARKTIERITPAVLAKAFRGELVPQDPNDESASVLLERVKSEAAKGTTSPNRRKRGSSV